MSLDEGLPQEQVNELVDETIEENEVVLFMKGTPIAPQCGYSEKAINHIQRHRDDVEAVDVLVSSEEFRTALERHSGWTTIPQVYVDGEFIGGSDILEELDEQGELAAELNA
jgi:monothiol glutaredoxin